MIPPEALGENLLLASSNFWWLHIACAHHSHLYLHLYIDFSFSVCMCWISLCLPLIRTLMMAFSVIQTIQDNLSIARSST